MRASSADCTTASMSSAESTTKGSLPPSSSTTFLRLRPATSATAAPARSEPVSETPRTRGSGMTISAICSLVAKMFSYAPSGRPASARISAIVVADHGHCGACLSSTVLPRMRLGNAKRATW